MSHCNLRSCTSNEFCQPAATDTSAASYATTSISTDTLWDQKSEPSPCSRQSYSKPRPTSVYHQPPSTAHSYVHRYVHPSQVQPMQSSIATTHAYIPPQYNTKPKSWDNLAAKGCGGYGFGYGYIVSNPKHQASLGNKAQPPMQQHVGMARKANQAPYGRYSAFAEVENYVPAPTQFVQEETITKTTIITTKSTENLISNQYPISDGSCECLVQPSPKQQQQQQIVASNCMACNVNNNNNLAHTSYQGYYSNLARNPSAGRCVIPASKTEITRL